MRTALMAFLAVSLLLGCTAERPAAPPASASTNDDAPPVAPAGAETVVVDLYRVHAADRSPFFQTEHRDRVDHYFEPGLAELIWKDAVTSKGEVGAIDFDPLYDAQDVEITNLAVQPAQLTGGNARVVVTFENHGTKEQLTYSLAPAGGAWKIADVTYRDGRTLRGILTSA